MIAPPAVGEYVAPAIPGSRFVLLDADRALPEPQRPEETIAAIRAFV